MADFEAGHHEISDMAVSLRIGDIKISFLAGGVRVIQKFALVRKLHKVCTSLQHYSAKGVDAWRDAMKSTRHWLSSLATDQPISVRIRWETTSQICSP
ncbi:unnamed protein product [Schistocephalus solidus]|uniref:Tnp_DDE_dom domain-containing protein n=1 Tax=Schistocephalus solidus TaxID=70667 RepID=A0A183SQY6_SCHSO|nr:unnamed protein product [Schistocephalus solidus]